MRGLGDLALRLKLRLLICGVAVAGVLTLTAINAALEVGHARAAGRQRLRSRADASVLAAGLALDLRASTITARALEPLRQDPGIREVLLRDEQGRPLVPADSPASAPRAARVSASWLDAFEAVTLDLPVRSEAGSSGTLHVEGSVAADVNAALRRAAVFGGAATLVALVLCGFLLSALRRAVREPLGEIIELIRQLRESGAPQRRLERRHHDEFGQIEEQVNELITDRERSERNLRAFKKDFELRVRERTRQLNAAVKEAQEAATRAEGASRAKSDFLARMSHEIRTPMNGILGMADLLQHSQSLDERQRRYAVVIHQSGNVLLQLINDVLDFSKIEAGKLELDKGRFCIREMVEDALEILAERAQSKGLELLCDIPLQIDTVTFGDCLRLRQVIINLLGNAVKFTERGDITIRVSREDTGIEQAAFTFEVIDTGIGIAEKDYGAIFESFAQADGSTTRRYGGTGLGLAISKQLVELMSGTIGVRSVLGQGSTFHFTVPLAVDRTAEREKSPPVLAESHILVVDKSSAVRRMLMQHLRSWGALPLECSSATEALDRLGKSFPGEVDLIVLDAALPGISAVDMVRRARAIGAFGETPILLLHTGSDVPPEARGVAGPVAWQSKPIRRAQLERALTRLMHGEPVSAAKRPEEAAPGPAPASTVRRSRIRNVLIVEDNSVNQEVARAMLESLGIDVAAASGGVDALTRLKSGHFDAVLMDCQMPELDGYATTRQFRDWELEQGRAHTPIIALTANALPGDAEKCFAAGMDQYLSKPFTVEQLHAILESFAAPGEAPDAAPDVRPGAAALDPKTVGRIQALAAAGRHDLLPRLAALFISSSAPLVATVRRAVGEANLEALLQAAHALKSSSGNVGALALSSLCRDLETACRNGDVEGAKALVERLYHAHAAVLAALEDWQNAA